MKVIFNLFLFFAAAMIPFGCSKTPKNETVVESKDTETRLLDGNKRYLNATPIKSRQLDKRRLEIAQTQKPIAAILSCSDSRVPPEIIFDQGIGDLFVIRLAGNVINDEALASIEYAVEHLGVAYIMVLGHERCGAVNATVKGGPNHHGHIESLIKAIKPAVEEARELQGDLLDNSVRSNIAMVVQQLSKSEPVLKELVKKEKLRIVGARYDLDDGKVEILQK